MAFALASSRGTPARYYQVPMCIIGKVYANSMLVLNDSRMLLGSTEAEPLAGVSELRFGAPPISDKGNITGAHHAAVSVDPAETTRLSRFSVV